MTNYHHAVKTAFTYLEAPASHIQANECRQTLTILREGAKVTLDLLREQQEHVRDLLKDLDVKMSDVLTPALKDELQQLNDELTKLNHAIAFNEAINCEASAVLIQNNMTVIEDVIRSQSDVYRGL